MEKNKGIWFEILIIITALLLLSSQWLIWVYAPVEATMGMVQKIFYFHLPPAWWALVSFFLVFIASIGFLWKKDEDFDLLAVSAAEIGVLFSTLVLVTGILWAKASWNTWWIWDPRLSTTLVMWFIYSSYLVLRHSHLPENKQKLMCAVLGIVGFVDVPLVFLSARLFRSIHPNVFASKEGGMPFEMLITVLVCLLAWGGLYLLLIILRFKQVKINSRLSTLIS